MSGTYQATKRGMSKKRERVSKFWPSVSDFMREREAVIMRQILMDASIRTSAYRTANAIAQHVNFEAGWAEVSYDKIADPFGVSHDTIARDLKDLERAGHFHVEWHKGRNGTHRVCWILKPQTRTGGFIGLAHENTVTSKTKAGGNRKGFADLRTIHYRTTHSMSRGRAQTRSPLYNVAL